MVFILLVQAFIDTAKVIYEKIKEGVFDCNNEVCVLKGKSVYVYSL